jgi:hypothetical protein
VAGSSVAKRRVTIDPRQTAIDFTAIAALPDVEIEIEPEIVAAPPRVAPETRIAALLTPRVGACEVVWTENRRTVLSSLRQPDRMIVRMHRIFSSAPDDLVDAMGRYLASGDRRASSAISRFIDANRGAIATKRAPRVLEARGTAHDLRAIFDALEGEHFAGQFSGVGITWGRHGHSPRSRRRSIRLGTYSHDERVIRVHPTLDQPWVPDFFVRFIVFHEMLHHVEPARETKSRTEFHTPSFRARERAYAEYERSIAWERANLGRLLRA